MANHQPIVETLINRLIDDILFEIAIESKSLNTKLSIQQSHLVSPLNDTQNTPTIQGISKGQGDNLNPNFECLICYRWISSNRYAPHLNNCLGLRGSRNSSRIGNNAASNAASNAATSSNAHNTPTETAAQPKRSSKFDYLDLSSINRFTM